MSRKKRKNIHPRLASLFKMTPEQVMALRRSGGGVHKKRKNRATLKRRAISEQINN